MLRWIVAALLISLASPAIAQLGNIEGTLLPSAARTAASTVSADIKNTSWRGAHVTIDMTAFVTGTFTPHIEGKDPVSGKYYILLSGAAISSNSTVTLKVYPGITAAANLAVSDVLPRTWRVRIAGAATPSGTYSVGFSMIQ